MVSRRATQCAFLVVSAAIFVDGFAPLSRAAFRSSPTILYSTEAVEDVPPPSTAETRPQIPDMEAYSTGYRTVFEEQRSKLCAPSEGHIPQDLSGTYFRVGPAMFSAGSIVPPKTSLLQPKQPPVKDGQDPDRMVKHPFEADGGLFAVTFSGANNNAVSRFRYIRTNAFTNERKRGERLYKSMDSTRLDLGACRENDLIQPLFRHHLQPGLNKNRKNTSNSRVIYWAKKLLTLWEGALPYKLDDLALSTEGRSQLGGVLKEKQPLGGKAVYDSKKDRLLLYSNQQDSKTSELTLMEFSPKFRLVSQTKVDLPGFAVINDFGATENYAIFVQPPVNVNGMQFMFIKEPGKVLQVESGPSTLHLVARDGSSKSSRTLSIPFDGVLDADLQFINAYEEGDSVVFDAIRMDDKNVGGKAASYPWASSLDDFSKSTCKRQLVRYTVDRNGVTKEVLSNVQSYFGVINPSMSTQKHRYIYVAIGSIGEEVAPPQGIARFDCETRETQTWMPKEYEFCGEPIFARSKTSEKEDDGYILSALFNGKTQESEMVILKAGDIGAGPIARVPLGIGVPPGLYGCYTEDGDYSFYEIERRAKLADKMESRGSMWNEVKSDFSGLGLRLDDMEEYFGDIM